MPIVIQPSKADRVRALKAQQTFLTAAEIAKLTGIPLPQVKAALARKPKRRIKSGAD
jgi:Fic family protein